ncbi:hypothetical protein QQ045_029413 [Rhodiola kirilowii]
MGRKRTSSPVNVLFGWVRGQSMKVKVFLGVTTVLSCLLALRLAVRDYDNFFVAAESIHAAGILVLIYKLTTHKTCSGLSLKTQELTSMFLVARLICSSVMEKDIHTVLDFAALVASVWVIYMIRYKLKSSYIKELDNMPLYYLAVPCAVLALLIYPHTSHHFLFGMLWAFCVYLESISVYPQLCVMQNAKMVEPFTAHYVFALGAARFLGFAHWVLVVYETGGKSLFVRGSTYLWLPAVLISEIIQTFILADFCYYYVKSAMYGQLLTRLPSPV